MNDQTVLRVGSLMVGSLMAFVACGGAPAPNAVPSGALPSAGEPKANASATPAAGTQAEAPDVAPSAGSAAALPVGSKAPEMPVSDRWAAHRVFERPVKFLSWGADGRLAVIAEQDGRDAPYQYVAKKWEALPLPNSEAEKSGPLSAGIYFGRDNRARLMGYRKTDDGVSMVYLRHKGGAWKPEPSEIGRLAKNPQAPLFGVLGDADPEVVCKLGDICLVKSRKGWNELPVTVPVDAVVRAFNGKGYAVSKEGVQVAGSTAFESKLGNPPWTTQPTGFWIGANSAVVIEGAKEVIHQWDGSAWTSKPSPLAGVRDAVATASELIVVGTGGMAAIGAGGATRIGEVTWSFNAVHLRDDGSLVAAGKSGVVLAEATASGPASASP